MLCIKLCIRSGIMSKGMNVSIRDRGHLKALKETGAGHGERVF